MAAVKKRALDMLLIASAAGAATFTFAPVAQADYAVLKTGVRLHITGYEQTGNQIRLTVTGGTVDLLAADLVSIEPEDQFTAPPTIVAATKGPYGNLIRAAAEKHGVDEKLITHVIAVESNFNPRATSHKQALGLMQLLPATAAKYSVSNIFDPAENIDAGTHYLKDLLSPYSGNLSLALAAYNAGPETVSRYGGIPPFRETQKYVQKITTILAREKSQIPSNYADAEFSNFEGNFLTPRAEFAELLRRSLGRRLRLRLHRLAGVARRRAKRTSRPKRTAAIIRAPVSAGARRNATEYATLAGRSLLLLSGRGIFQRIPDKFPFDVFFPAMVELHGFSVAGAGHSGQERAQHRTIHRASRLQSSKGGNVGLARRSSLEG